MTAADPPIHNKEKRVSGARSCMVVRQEFLDAWSRRRDGRSPL